MQSKKALLVLASSGKFWQDCSVHEGLNSNGVESRREANFFKAGAVHEGKFLNLFNLCVGKVNFLE